MRRGSLTALAGPFEFDAAPATTAVMRANKKTDTRPELRLRSALHASGLRFRKNHALVEDRVRVCADIVFKRRRLAIFVDGCFWHSCPEHGTTPRRNETYWRPKLARNLERDRATDAALGSAGWTVLRVWEHEDASSAAARIAALVLSSTSR